MCIYVHVCACALYTRTPVHAPLHTISYKKTFDLMFVLQNECKIITS